MLQREPLDHAVAGLPLRLNFSARPLYSPRLARRMQSVKRRVHQGRAAVDPVLCRTTPKAAPANAASSADFQESPYSEKCGLPNTAQAGRAP